MQFTRKCICRKLCIVFDACIVKSSGLKGHKNNGEKLVKLLKTEPIFDCTVTDYNVAITNRIERARSAVLICGGERRLALRRSSAPNWLEAAICDCVLVQMCTTRFHHHIRSGKRPVGVQDQTGDTGEFSAASAVSGRALTRLHTWKMRPETFPPFLRWPLLSAGVNLMLFVRTMMLEKKSKYSMPKSELKFKR